MNTEAGTISHSLSGPFVVAAHGATPSGQTETVYAVRVETTGRQVEFWDVSPNPHSAADVQGVRQMVRRGNLGYGEVISVSLVARTVTITATEWSPVDGE